MSAQRLFAIEASVLSHSTIYPASPPELPYDRSSEYRSPKSPHVHYLLPRLELHESA